LPDFKTWFKEVAKNTIKERIVLRNLASSQIWLNKLRYFVGYNTKLTPKQTKETLLQTHFQTTCQTVALPFTLKKCLLAKEEL
jgi:hypothetical protein